MRFLPHWDAVPCALCVTPIESDTPYFQDARRTINKLHWIELHEPCNRKMDYLRPCQPPSPVPLVAVTLEEHSLYSSRHDEVRSSVEIGLSTQGNLEIMLVWVNPDKNQGNSELRAQTSPSLKPYQCSLRRCVPGDRVSWGVCLENNKVKWDFYYYYFRKIKDGFRPYTCVELLARNVSVPQLSVFTWMLIFCLTSFIQLLNFGWVQGGCSCLYVNLTVAVHRLWWSWLLSQSRCRVGS